MERFLICKFILVREIDATWNLIYDSILLMYQKLKSLEFEYRQGKVVIKPEDANDGLL
ncbi:MAG TPA: hypothetical protein VLF91_05055 [Candidatus Saccharimonadales bacterium]|nr:hypothetical protein [Candidatus Saccharimonadales bacterium]